MKYISRIQALTSKSNGKCLRSIASKPNQNLKIAPKNKASSKNSPANKLKINRLCSKNGLKITHIGLKIDALESLYIESQLKITPLLLKIESPIGLKIDCIGLKIAGGGGGRFI